MIPDLCVQVKTKRVYNCNSINMKKVLVWGLILVSLLALVVRFSSNVPELVFGIKQKSGLSVMSNPEGAVVFVDNQEVGTTPYNNEELSDKEYTVRLEKDGMVWQGKIRLNANTISVINRDLAKDTTSSAGEVLTLERGKGVTIISSPSNADVEVDGKIFGKTPVQIDVEPGEHSLTITFPNYLKRSISAKLPEGFNLTIASDLALAEADLTTFIAPVITSTPEVIVKETPTNFLRVRDKGSLSGREISRVNPGDTLILLSEEGSWLKVKLPNGTEGYVSATYVEKKQ